MARETLRDLVLAVLAEAGPEGLRASVLFDRAIARRLTTRAALRTTLQALHAAGAVEATTTTGGPRGRVYSLPGCAWCGALPLAGVDESGDDVCAACLPAQVAS